METREKELNFNTDVADTVIEDDEVEEKQKVDAPELLEVKIAIKRNMPAAKENKNDSAVVVDDRDWSAIQHHISRKLRKNLTLVSGDQNEETLREFFSKATAVSMVPQRSKDTLRAEVTDQEFVMKFTARRHSFPSSGEAGGPTLGNTNWRV